MKHFGNETCWEWNILLTEQYGNVTKKFEKLNVLIMIHFGSETLRKWNMLKLKPFGINMLETKNFGKWMKYVEYETCWKWNTLENKHFQNETFLKWNILKPKNFGNETFW